MKKKPVTSNENEDITSFTCCNYDPIRVKTIYNIPQNINSGYIWIAIGDDFFSLL